MRVPLEGDLYRRAPSKEVYEVPRRGVEKVHDSGL